MSTAVVKMEPKSEGIATPRKKRPKELAIITECCTGCAGSPACVPYCPVADCMYWVPDEDHPPFGHIEVDPVLCIGCKKCTSKGPDGAFLDGCPWDAIEMVADRRSGSLSRHQDAGLTSLIMASRSSSSEREGITILDLKGRITVGPEATALRDSSRGGDRGRHVQYHARTWPHVDYIDSTGLGALVMCATSHAQGRAAT